jgi:uncharacterized repeat protein (TIGR03806 family)
VSNTQQQPPLARWLSATLWLTGAINVAQGAVCLLFYKRLFAALQIDASNVSLFAQLTGVLLISLGVGLWLVARSPIAYRGLLALIAAALLVVGVLAMEKISRGRLPAGFLPVVLLCQFAVLPPLVLIAQQLFATSRPTNNSNFRRWTFPLAWCLLVLSLVAPTALAMRKAVRDSRHIQNTLPPLALTGFQSKFPAVAEHITPLVTEVAFHSLRFIDPTFITPMPGDTGELAVLERGGKIFVFDNTPGVRSKRLFLDISDRTMKLQNRAEDGLFCVAFHPDYLKTDSQHAGEFFVHYTAKVKGDRYNRLSKFKLPPNANQADAAGEVVLIETRDIEQSHNGGSVLFGPDGFLYLCLGDDGQQQPNPHAQHIDNSLFSGILRLDVNCTGGDVSHAPPRQPNVSHTANYFIPNDNPFVGVPNALEEFYAIGLRNPWRATFDHETGNLWVGDVGDRRREQIHIVKNGSNCGWAYREGSIPTTSYDPKSTGRPEKYFGVETMPVFEYEHDAMNRCVIGGYVYHGKQFPELVGKYIYADQCGRIYALEVDDQQKLVSNKLIAVMDDPGLGVSTLGEDTDGELFICIIKELAQDSGEIHRLRRAVTSPAEPLPRLLSETGLFTDLKTLEPAPGLNPYEIINPLWSDRAAKRRWIGLPANQKITGDIGGQWKFPVGTVLVKHFELPLDETAANSLRRLETRVMVCDANGAAYGATYRWNADQTDAALVNESQTAEIEYRDEHGAAQKQTWLYPGRFECMTCHNKPTGYVIGFNSKQLNRAITLSDKSGNQMLRFANAGMFAPSCTEQQLSQMPRLAAMDDASASVEDRARSYLDANCAQCHRPGHVFGAWDARFETPLASQGIVNGLAYMHKTDSADARIVRPGNPQESFLAIRLGSAEHFKKMPPLGRNLVDQKALALVTQWITSLPPSPAPPRDDSTQANP